MILYEKMIWINFELIKGREFTETEKEKITTQFLMEVSDQTTAKRFYKGVRFPNNIDGDGRQMYPVFYIPPYNNGKKYKTITSVTPKTHILSANAYELEILRILAVIAPNHDIVLRMLRITKERLKTTCFGKFCAVGECFESSVVVLRFLGTVFPNEIEWMKKLMKGIDQHMNDKKRHSGIFFYYLLCLSELPLKLALPEIESYKEELLKGINRSYVMNSEHDRYNSPLGKYILRNCLARLPEYAYIKDRVPFISDKDGRLYFNMEV